jgi:anti-sigma regulatory factor (Ser/Thr protein kinase)
MTQDSSLALDNADWTTADGSAGRLVSGTLDAVLITGQVLKVYSNGTYIGDAVVNGKAWEITDTTGYTTGWTYTAKVQDGSGNTGPTTTQIVNTDFTEAAPVITSVIDTANASIGIGGTTTSALSTVSGTGTAGDTVYLYDNTGTNLVGSTTVAAGGAWSISGLATNDAVGGGTNTFSARQMDSLGNVSVLSNTWTVTAAGSNLLTNGNFASGFTGFSSGLTSTGTTYSYTSTAGGFAVGPLSGAGAMNPVNTATTANSGPTAYTFGTWSKKTIASYVNPNGAFSGDALYGEVQQSTVATILSQNVKVTAGKTYTFKFDYATTAFDLQGLRAIIDGASIDVTTKNNGQESGQFSVTYVATSDKTINLSLTGGHTRASDIIVQLRKFLRSGSSEFELISMSDVVEESVAMIQAELTRHEITLTQEVDSTVLVWADEGQLQMVVLNLLKNALDVLRAVPLPREIHVQLGQTAQANMLTVSDNGPGIDESDRARVFEVFFSTKAEGMGLGLWLSHSIVRNHGGELQVSSSPTGGACFTLTLHKKVA